MSDESEMKGMLEELRRDHRHAEARLQELTRHLSLSLEEQAEYARLKKRKLALKDEIRALTTRIGE